MIAERRRRWTRASPGSITLVALVASVIVTVAIAFVADRMGRRAMAAQTELLAKQVAARVGACVVTRVEMVTALEREWALGGLRDSSSFIARVDALLATFPGYLAVNRIDASGEIVEVYPFDANRAALGRNVNHTPGARAAFQAAIASKSPRLSAPIPLFQGGVGVALYVPTNEGIVFNGVFRTSALIPACLEAEVVADHSLSLQDQVLGVFHRDLGTPDPAFGVTQQFSVLDRTWTLRLAPASKLVAAALRPSRLFLITGLGLSLAASVLLLAMLRGRARVRASARRAEEERARLVALADAANDYIAIVDGQGSIRYMNRVALEITGIELGKPVEVPDLIAAEDIDAFVAHIKRCQANGTSNVELRIRNIHTGEVVPLEFHSFMMESPDGPWRATVGRDLRERMRYETSLQQAQKLEVLGRLAGGVAHDFNNLLTVILSGLHLLDARKPPDPEVLANISDAAWRGAALTRELLALGRRSANEMIRVDLAQVASSLRRLLGRIVPKDIALSITTPDTPVIIVGSPVQIDQILLNLAMNAVGAMPNGGKLGVEVRRDGEHAVLIVADSGTGMTPEIAARIFEPFFTTKQQGEGTGLGLATVSSNVERMKGTIDVDTAPGKGTRFIVRFPASADQRPRVTTPRPVATPGLPQTLLLVDDDKAVRSAVARMLESSGISVVEADGGRMAIAQLEQPDPKIELVVTDLAMPEMTGVELLTWIREHRPGLGVVFISANLDNGIDLTALGVRCVDKPIVADKLTAAITAAMTTQPSASTPS